MKLFKQLSVSISLALVVASSGLFAIGNNSVHAQASQDQPITEVLNVKPQQPTGVEQKDPNPALKVDALKENEPVIEQKNEALAQTSTTLQKTTEELNAIEAQKQALAAELAQQQSEVEALKAKVAEKNRVAAEQAVVSNRVTPSNPNGCDLNTQWIRADNGQCKDKATAVAAPAPVTPSPSVRIQTAAATSTPTTYEGGQCTWHVKNLRPDLPNNLGNANQWYANAQAQGLPTGTVARPGAAAPRKTGMHVVYVREVYANGTMLVDEMNYDYVAYHQRTAIKNQADFNYIY